MCHAAPTTRSQHRGKRIGAFMPSIADIRDQLSRSFGDICAVGIVSPTSFRYTNLSLPAVPTTEARRRS
jgi:hypothetical protein